jgi:hypothetical protein
MKTFLCARGVGLAGLLLAAACSEPSGVANDQVPEFQSADGLPAAAIRVTQCGVLSTPGDYWLTKDLTHCTGQSPALTINAPGAILHLNRHTISSSPNGQAGICISVDADGISIEGPGVLRGCSNMGIQMQGSNTVVRWITVDEYDEGMFVYGSNNLVEYVVFRGSASPAAGYAAVIDVGNQNIFRKNRLLAASEKGFQLRSNAMVESNLIAGPGWGIAVQGAGARITGNRIAHAGTGILVDGTGNVIEGNILKHNSEDIVDHNDNACAVNTYLGNRFSFSIPDCIQ